MSQAGLEHVAPSNQRARKTTSICQEVNDKSMAVAGRKPTAVTPAMQRGH